jgi:catechol 2,3-dioxygenase-like lactoylglutathione lyase family enzyme
MIDHIGLHVRDVARATEFYRKALAPLGYGIVMPGLDGGDQRQSRRRLRCGAGAVILNWQGEPASGPVHVAFVAQTRAAVDVFYATALKAGGTDAGTPGLRPQYHANYYAAFVFDPDGNNAEAVCHLPE